LTFTGWGQRKAIGEKKRSVVRTEEGYYPAFERLLQLHGLDFWHNTIAQRSQPGWPDFTIFGDGWHAWVELKARNLVSGRAGKLSHDQERYRDTIVRAGGEWRLFTLPDEWDDVDEWLNEKTHKNIRGLHR
jgi:hypothetical protein